MMNAGQEISKQLKFNEFRSTLDSEALPVVAGVSALSAIGEYKLTFCPLSPIFSQTTKYLIPVPSHTIFTIPVEG